jgi:prepilin-type N-terminal cleavage/methylation domain-containing protein
MNRSSDGFTLIELMVVIAVVAILLTVAGPSYQKLIERNRLKEASQAFKSDLQFARMEAIKRSRNVFFSRTAGNAGSWCYGMGTLDCDCAQTDTTAADFCDIKRVEGASYPVVSLAAGGTTEFDFRRGTATAMSSVLTTLHYAAQVRVNDVGRADVCDPDPMPLDADGDPLEGLYGSCE